MDAPELICGFAFLFVLSLSLFILLACWRYCHKYKRVISLDLAVCPKNQHMQVVVEKEIVYETVYKEREGAAPPAGYLSPAEIAQKILAKEEEIMGKVAKEMATRQVRVFFACVCRNTQTDCSGKVRGVVSCFVLLRGSP